MIRAVAILTMMVSTQAFACNDPAHLNAQRDQARALERQAESLKSLERVERDRNRMLDRAQRR